MLYDLQDLKKKRIPVEDDFFCVQSDGGDDWKIEFLLCQTGIEWDLSSSFSSSSSSIFDEFFLGS